jgi:hypothetical protein
VTADGLRILDCSCREDRLQGTVVAACVLLVAEIDVFAVVADFCVKIAAVI